MSAAHDAKLREILDLNPGKRFRMPDAWYGNRPVYYWDSPLEISGYTTGVFLKDPEGFVGYPSDFAGWTLTPTPATNLFGEPWLLPASTGPGNSPDDEVSSWGYADPSTGALTWFNVRRNGKLTPLVAGTGLPPAWALAMSPYTAADFDLTRWTMTTAPVDPGTVPTTPPPATTTTQVSAGGTPITGNPADRYLVNGVTYDGTGKVLHVDQTAQQAPPGTTTTAGRNWLPLAIIAGGLYVARRAQHRR